MKLFLQNKQWMVYAFRNLLIRLKIKFKTEQKFLKTNYFVAIIEYLKKNMTINVEQPIEQQDL